MGSLQHAGTKRFPSDMPAKRCSFPVRLKSSSEKGGQQIPAWIGAHTREADFTRCTDIRAEEFAETQFARRNRIIDRVCRRKLHGMAVCAF